MARMIDADALLEHIKDLPTWWADGGGVYGQAMKYPEGMFDAEDVVASIENAPTLTQPNEPLTLEQLREMNGEPVWGKSLITDKPGEWFILRVVEMSKTWFIACAGAEQGFGDKDTYGKTWLAYRRPPEGEKL